METIADWSMCSAQKLSSTQPKRLKNDGYPPNIVFDESVGMFKQNVYLLYMCFHLITSQDNKSLRSWSTFPDETLHGRLTIDTSTKV